MSLIALFLPLLVPVDVIVNEAVHDAQEQDKVLAADGGYSASDWSKAKAGKRSLDLHRIAKMPDAFQLALVRRWGAALGQQPERDLVADLIGRVEKLLAVVGKPAKADLRDDEQERRRA